MSCGCVAVSWDLFLNYDWDYVWGELGEWGKGVGFVRVYGRVLRVDVAGVVRVLDAARARVVLRVALDRRACGCGRGVGAAGAGGVGWAAAGSGA